MRETLVRGLAVASLLGLAVLAGATGCSRGSRGDANALLCYVGGTMRPAMEYLAGRYEKETGRKVHIDYADSGELLIKVQTTRRGDLIVVHDPFQLMLVRKGFSRKGWTVATLTPTIAVQKGNPKKIVSLRDLARPDVKVGLTDPEHSTMGYIVPKMLAKADLKAVDVKPGVPTGGANVVRVYTRTKGGGQIATKVGMGELDAAIVWNAVIHARSRMLDAVPIDPPYRLLPGVDAVTSATNRRYDLGQIKVTLDVLTCSKHPDAATDFARYVDAHRDVFVAKYGFSPAPAGQAAATAPATAAAEVDGKELLLYCGAGLRHAMTELTDTFAAKTGVTVQADYAGSGVLISRLKLARIGDLFMPGEVWYLDQVAKEGLIADRKMVAYFVPVIIVQKGNPKGIKTLADLLRDGVKVALGNPKACQVGRATEELLIANGIDPNALANNQVFSSVTVNELGVQVQTKAADAAIVWDAIAANFDKDVDAVAIPLDKNVISDVAIGVLKTSKAPAAAEKFVDFLVSDEGRAIFRKHHYTVEPPKAPSD